AAARRAARDGVQHGAGPTPHAGAVDGRPLLPGHGGGLQGGAGGRVGVAAPLADAHHGRRHARAREGLRARRRGRGAAGDRHGAPARRGRVRVRRSAGGEGAGGEPGGELRRPGGGDRRGGGRRRLRRRARPGPAAARTRADPPAHPRDGPRHHDRAHPRAPGAAPHHPSDGAGHEGGRRDRGPRGGSRRQLRAHASRRDGARGGGHGAGAAQPPRHGAAPRQPDVQSQPADPATAPREGWRARRRSRGRDHRRDGRDPPGGNPEPLMSGISFIELYVFVLAAFVGYQVIARVPPLLHTPLMSATNAISGISLVGSLVLAGADYGTLATWLGFIAVASSSLHVIDRVVGTDRRAAMVRGRAAEPQRTALSRMFGAPAATLVGVAEYYRHAGGIAHVEMAALGFEVMFGSLTITGSFMAFGKLQELVRGAPITYRFQNPINISL